MHATTKEAPRSGTSFIRPFLFLFANSLFFWIGLNGISTVLPLQMQALGYSEQVAGWLMGLCSLSALSAQLALGGLVDRHGPRPALAAGGFLLLLAALSGYARLGIAGQVLLNVLQGVALTLLLIAGFAAASAVAPSAKRGTVVAWYGMANSLASLIGAPLTMPLFEAQGFEAVQLLVAACGLGAGLFALFVRVRPEAPAGPGGHKERLILQSAVRPGLLGAVLAIGAGGFMLVGPLRAQALGLPNPGLYVTIEAGALILSRLAFGWLSDKWGRGWAIIPGLFCLAGGFALMGCALPSLVGLVAPALIGIGIGAAGTGLITWTVERAGHGERGRAINTYYLFYEMALFVGLSGVGSLVSAWADGAYGVIAVVMILGVLVYLVPFNVGGRDKAKRGVV
jgi:MFS family permease